ncbi:glycosyltransferase [Muricauda sp. CAU 1633]|uniref:glycosyltransferase family 2 protein n=1 Tax=Allomuricauda sp. CAU 1633 TaxID=2816036 RepID=UPI001A8D3131|nr:glycosyltransferase [Muricauda sp. CAU 1633]MBO0320978.1 glycosyltransferase [Muricauda sp. CAU 1633]
MNLNSEREERNKTYLILVNYRSWKDTVECLESILKLTNQNFQVFIIDNSPDQESSNSIMEWARGNYGEVNTQFPDLVFPSSSPITLRYLEEEDLKGVKDFHEKIILVKAIQNKGFAAANNIALEHLRSNQMGNYIWLLNNDTVVAPHSLDSLIDAHNTTKADLIGSCLYEYYERDAIQSVGGTYTPILGRIQLKKNFGDKCDYPIGASMFITRQFLDEVGLMCEDYFLFFEEYDWVLRAKRKGLEFYNEDRSKIYHKGSAAIGNASLLADFYSIKSKILFNKRFFRRSFAVFCFIFGSMFCLNRIKRGQFSRAKLFFQLLMNPNLQFHEIKHK